MSIRKSAEVWNELSIRISRSSFRSQFKLAPEDMAYYESRGTDAIRIHASDFITRRLAPAVIPNDGKQTPFRGHPVFIAQHATALCCRGCAQKWHGIEKDREMTKDEIDYAVDIVMRWLNAQMSGMNTSSADSQQITMFSPSHGERMTAEG